MHPPESGGAPGCFEEFCKFSTVDSSLESGAWGKFFNGRNGPKLTTYETKFRNQIEDCFVRQADANQIT